LRSKPPRCSLKLSNVNHHLTPISRPGTSASPSHACPSPSRNHANVLMHPDWHRTKLASWPGMDPATYEAEFCYQPTIGQFGLFTWDWVPFPLVTIEFLESSVRIPTIARKLGPVTVFSTSRRANYHEFERAEAIILPAFLPLRTLGRSTVPFGIRIRMKEPRARVLLFSRQCHELLEEIALHGIQIEPHPKKLNFLLIGRK
jgi:hypothetical protein